ncbi:hypothetical protein E2562_020719 [Oryza meyeriana var. granulata]|uniref:Trichome birefringence-like C-terminal domain-containing protein n=1 Tax=Oryza meyeriana var. granulata TaxID=110450 RepID=A0A6G1EN39_9ORYZ|nr:hypothetical protein E2562_020719 [Oryza meyeriana var. granulata]
MEVESLLYLLASCSPSELVYWDGEENRFQQWAFREHNATVSIFWSPFLVKVTEKAKHASVRHNNMFLDSFDEQWLSRLWALDAVVVGCHDCAEFNHTEIPFFGIFKEAVHRTLAEINRRHVAGGADKNKNKEWIIFIEDVGSSERGCSRKSTQGYKIYYHYNICALD